MKRFLKLEDIIGSQKKGIPAIFPVSRATWYLGIKQGRFPKPKKIGQRINVWKEEEIEELIAKLNSQNESK